MVPILKFWVEGIPPSDNTLRRLVWQAQARDRRMWREAAAFSATTGSFFPPHTRDSLPLRRVLLRFEFHFKSKRRHDWDNLAASLKPIIDGVVDAGVVADDDIDHVWCELMTPVYDGVDGVRVYVVEDRWAPSALAEYDR